MSKKRLSKKRDSSSGSPLITPYASSFFDLDDDVKSLILSYFSPNFLEVLVGRSRVASNVLLHGHCLKYSATYFGMEASAAVWQCVALQAEHLRQRTPVNFQSSSMMQQVLKRATLANYVIEPSHVDHHLWIALCLRELILLNMSILDKWSKTHDAVFIFSGTALFHGLLSTATLALEHLDCFDQGEIGKSARVFSAILRNGLASIANHEVESILDGGTIKLRDGSRTARKDLTRKNMEAMHVAFTEEVSFCEGEMKSTPSPDWFSALMGVDLELFKHYFSLKQFARDAISAIPGRALYEQNYKPVAVSLSHLLLYDYQAFFGSLLVSKVFTINELQEMNPSLLVSYVKDPELLPLMVRAFGIKNVLNDRAYSIVQRFLLMINRHPSVQTAYPEEAIAALKCVLNAIFQMGLDVVQQEHLIETMLLNRDGYDDENRAPEIFYALIDGVLKDCPDVSRQTKCWLTNMQLMFDRSDVCYLKSYDALIFAQKDFYKLMQEKVRDNYLKIPAEYCLYFQKMLAKDASMGKIIIDACITVLRKPGLYWHRAFEEGRDLEDGDLIIEEMRRRTHKQAQRKMKRQRGGNFSTPTSSKRSREASYDGGNPSQSRYAMYFGGAQDHSSLDLLAIAATSQGCNNSVS